jgi:two-component system, cell cycle sensor histidine kinase and response regulator CckA
MDRTGPDQADLPASPSAAFYRTLLEHSFDGIAIVDENAVFTFHNAAACRMLGTEPDALVGTNALDLLHPDDVARSVETLASLNAQAEVLHPTIVRLRRLDDGNYVTVEVRAMNLLHNSEVGGIVVNFSDVSAEHAAMQALRESEQRLEVAIRGSGMGLWDWDVMNDTVSWDGRLAEILGVEAAELGTSGAEIRARLHPDDVEGFQAALDAHLQQRQAFFQHEYRLRAGDGSYKWVVARGKIMSRDSAGAPIRLVGTHVDVDQRHRDLEQQERLREQLLSAQKMESIGQLAGGVAHDFNNIVQVVLANARFAADEKTDRASMLQALHEIEEMGERAAQLTRQLLAFGRRQAMTRSVLDLNDLLRQNLQLLGRVLPENIEVDFRPQPGILAAAVDAGQFDRVIANLCVNARDAMPRGGRLRISSRKCELDPGDQLSEPWAQAGSYAVISIEDNGSGMDPEVQRRAFEPFFTTKREGIGSGLGLAMVEGIVRQHDGLVRVQSAPGTGSTFDLYFPLANAPVERQRGPRSRKANGGSETVLVAEDESAVRRLVGRILESAGYTVILAKDGEEALEAFFANPDRVDLVLLDVVMPRRNGREVFEEIMRRAPRPVLFTSGYSADALPADFLKEHGLLVLPKPYSPDRLLEQVRMILDESLGLVTPLAE